MGVEPFVRLNEKGIKFYYSGKDKKTLKELLEDYKNNLLELVSLKNKEWLRKNKILHSSNHHKIKQ